MNLRNYPKNWVDQLSNKSLIWRTLKKNTWRFHYTKVLTLGSEKKTWIKPESGLEPCKKFLIQIYSFIE